MKTGLVTLDGFPRDDIDVAQSASCVLDDIGDLECYSCSYFLRANTFQSGPSGSS